MYNYQLNSNLDDVLEQAIQEVEEDHPELSENQAFSIALRRIEQSKLDNQYLN